MDEDLNLVLIVAIVQSFRIRIVQLLSDFLRLLEQPVRQTVLVGRHFMITDAVPDRVLKSGHQPFHTPDLFLVSLNGEMFLKESDVGIIPRQTEPNGTVFQIGILQKPVRAVLVAVGPDGNDQCQDQC